MLSVSTISSGADDALGTLLMAAATTMDPLPAATGGLSAQPAPAIANVTTRQSPNVGLHFMWHHSNLWYLPIPCHSFSTCEFHPAACLQDHPGEKASLWHKDFHG